MDRSIGQNMKSKARSDATIFCLSGSDIPCRAAKVPDDVPDSRDAYQQLVERHKDIIRTARSAFLAIETDHNQASNPNRPK